MQAALGVQQLERIEAIVRAKRRIAARYTSLLRELSQLQLPVEREWAKNVYWMYGIVLDEDTGLTASELADRLRELGVDTRPFFVGLHEQPVLAEYREQAGLFPVATRLARQGLYLPSGLALSDPQMDQVVDAIRVSLS
jgi:perosamine synthetase